ncbi:MAG TPA: YggS family pyridoxal phosphate-dependent enzyme, partial [Burkholderiaceae bacterium]
MSAIASNLQAVRDTIAASARAVLRNPAEIALLAVSKTFGGPEVLAAAGAGQRAFGENYLQEALDKMTAVQALQDALPAGDPAHGALEWHFIGPIQSNKTRPIAAQFAWVHSVERLSIAQRLSSQRPEHLPDLQICLQVNISGEASKSGVHPNDAPALAREIAALPRLRLRGLMAIPEPAGTFEAQRAPYRALRGLYE